MVEGAKITKAITTRKTTICTGWKLSFVPGIQPVQTDWYKCEVTFVLGEIPDTVSFSREPVQRPLNPPVFPFLFLFFPFLVLPFPLFSSIFFFIQSHKIHTDEFNNNKNHRITKSI
jgi:hypothetical protein